MYVSPRRTAPRRAVERRAQKEAHGAGGAARPGQPPRLVLFDRRVGGYLGWTGSDADAGVQGKHEDEDRRGEDAERGVIIIVVFGRASNYELIKSWSF